MPFKVRSSVINVWFSGTLSERAAATMVNFGINTSFGGLIVTVLLCLLCVAAQPGFLSIDCGATANYTDSRNMTWVTDANFIKIGQTENVSNMMRSADDYLNTWRYFPKPLNKSCYELPVKPNVTYLLRLQFLFGYYNGIQQLPTFQFSLETQGTLFSMDVLFDYPQERLWYEEIVTSLSDVLYICFIRKGSGGDDPFISSIELRPFTYGMYDHVKPGKLLQLLKRYDLAAQASNISRYPQDPFDRIWLSDNFPGAWGNDILKVQSNKPISTGKTKDRPPSSVMQTAIIENYDSCEFPLRNPLLKGMPQHLLVMYFAEIQILSASESRIFDVIINNQTLIPRLNVLELSEGAHFSSVEQQVVFKSTAPASEWIYVELNRTEHSTRGPMINAFEHYIIFDTDPETSPDDVGALSLIKTAFNLTDWISDPCYVVPWEGITCDTNSPSRVLEINLSGRNLTGLVPTSIAHLTELTTMSLDNNHLTGPLPNLSNLTNLQTL